MNARVLLIVCLVSSLVALVLLFAVVPSSTSVSAQSPIVSADEASRPAGAVSPEKLDEGAPDARVPAAPAACGVSAVNCLYYHISSSLFQGRDSTSTYAYDGSGCFHHTSASVNGFMAPVLLTHGSIIKYIRVYYIDTSASDMTMRLRYFDDGTSSVDLTTVSTSGSAMGVRTALSAEITHTVAYDLYSYGILAFESGPTDGSIQLCGVRLAYIPGAYGLDLPFIAR